MRACDMVTLIKLSKAVWTRAIYKAVFKKKSPCRSRKDGWTLLPDPQVWRRHTGLMHDVIYLTCSPLYFDQTSQLYAELRYLSTPLGACCLDILSQFIQEHSWLFKTIYCNQCNTSTLKPLNWRKLEYPWEDGSFSRRWVHVRGEEDECERLDLNRQVPPLDKCDLGNDWPADYQLGRQLLCFWLPWVLRWASFQTLFHIFMVLCTLACCKRCQCTEPREVSGVIAWLHLLQCFLSTSLLGDTRWGQSAMVSCQKRALVLSCTWLERDMMLGKRKSAGSHISSNIPACSFLCRKPTRLPDIGQCFFSLQSKNKKTLPSEFLITVLLMTAVVGNTHVFSIAREQLTKTKRLHARARPFSEITARSPTVEALASRYL